MAAEEEGLLRIHCICGQKMRVSENMFGRPGKCVACRQKIRIPKKDEIPGDTNEIYLKDHPEFLRHPKSQRQPEPKPREVPPEPVRERSRSDDRPPSPEEIPLTPLEPLQVLCSLEHKIQYQLESLEEFDEHSDTARAERERAQLDEYAEEVRDARGKLDEKLRQRLTEVKIELKNTYEKLSERSLAGRMGDTPFEEYLRDTDRLRHRRDFLESRKHDLTAWLGVTDPHMAGGYLDVPLDQCDHQPTQINLPSKRPTTEPLVNLHVESLRKALYDRLRAEARLAEFDEMGREGAVFATGATEQRDDLKAAILRADATVRFYRGRLRQIEKDYAADVKTIDAQLAQIRSRNQAGQLSRVEFEALEKQYLRAKGDATKAGDLALRALAANSPQDVPHPHGTFLQRLAVAGQEAPVVPDSWIAWSSSLLLLFSIFLPAIGGQSLIGVWGSHAFRDDPARWIVLIPLTAATIQALVAAIPKRTVRTVTMTGFWFAVVVCAGYLIHESDYIPGLVAERFREANLWIFRPGILFLLLAGLTTLCAIIFATLNTKRLYPIVAGIVMAGFCGLLLVFTNFFGYAEAHPVVSVSRAESVDQGGNRLQSTTLMVKNEGHRTLYLVSGDSSLLNAYIVVLKSKMGPNSWDNLNLSDSGMQPITPGEQAVFSLTLPPGEYQCVVLQPATRWQSQATEFVLSELDVLDVEEEAVTEETAQPASETEDEMSLEDSPAPAAEETPLDEPVASVELRGIMAAPGREPRLSLYITRPDGTDSRLDVAVGDSVYDGWTALEFNPEHQTLTLSKEGRYLVLRRGEPVRLRSSSR